MDFLHPDGYAELGLALEGACCESGKDGEDVVGWWKVDCYGLDWRSGGRGDVQVKRLGEVQGRVGRDVDVADQGMEDI